jgi:hypothetical protein
MSDNEGTREIWHGLGKALGNLLAESGVRENIDAIVIQGRTDERGSATFNWDLSAKRATALDDYLFETNKSLADAYASILRCQRICEISADQRGADGSRVSAESSHRDCRHSEGCQCSQSHR